MRSELHFVDEYEYRLYVVGSCVDVVDMKSCLSQFLVFVDSASVKLYKNVFINYLITSPTRGAIPATRLTERGKLCSAVKT